MARVVLVESFRPVESRIVKYEIILYIKKKRRFRHESNIVKRVYDPLSQQVWLNIGFIFIAFSPLAHIIIVYSQAISLSGQKTTEDCFEIAYVCTTFPPHTVIYIWLNILYDCFNYFRICSPRRRKHNITYFKRLELFKK